MTKFKVFIKTIIIIIFVIVLNNIIIIPQISYAALSIAIIACVILGVYSGIAVAAVSYFIISMYDGWPMGLYNHIIMIGIMLVIIVIFNICYGKNKISGFIVLCALNIIMSTCPFILELGTAFSVRMALPFMLISLVNAIIAFWGAQLLLKSGVGKLR